MRLKSKVFMAGEKCVDIAALAENAIKLSESVSVRVCVCVRERERVCL